MSSGRDEAANTGKHYLFMFLAVGLMRQITDFLLLAVVSALLMAARVLGSV